jgi:hypothetical protein
MLAKGWVRTGGHSRQLHKSLIARGLAVYFDGSLPPPPEPSANEMKRVADRVRTMMGVDEQKELLASSEASQGSSD